MNNKLFNISLKKFSTTSIKCSQSVSTPVINELNRKTLKQGLVTSPQLVPSYINKPEYAITGKPLTFPSHIYLYDKEDIIKIRKAAKLARKMLDFANSKVCVGITTDEIDRLTHEEIIKHGAYPSPINYYGFPKSICTSVNEVVCHGIPDNRPLENGDVISIDISLYLDGFHGDNCGTVIVGEGDSNLEHLIKTTQQALDNAIEICKPGAKLSDIGKTIENFANENNFQVIHEFCGHGTGKYLHMLPFVCHYNNTDDLKLAQGMVFTIEPIIVEGDRKIETWEDGWTAVTVDRGRAAQFEHEVLITKNGVEVLTLPD